MKRLNLQSLLKIGLLVNFWLPLALFCESLEVSLPTRQITTPIYLTQLHVPSSEFDWRYFDELRQVLEFDLNANGSASVVSGKNELEESLAWPEVRSNFNVNRWKKEQIPYVLAIQVFQNKFQLVVFDIHKETSKKYPDFVVSGKLDKDRVEIHHLADAVQRDVFKTEGVASSKIIYSKRCKGVDGWNSEIWVSDSDGANARRVLSEKGYCMSPAFFPSSIAQGDEFFYVSFQEGQSKIYRSALGKTSGEPMIFLRGSQALPAINKKGDQIAFITDVSGRPDLFIQNLGTRGQPMGKPRQLFSIPRSTQASPTYSPDGKQIAFVSDKDGVPRVYLIDVLGPKDTARPNPKLLTRANRENTSPAWSPDGSKLAFSAKVDGVRQIWIYDFSTQTESPLTFGPDNKENPSWSPDSMHIVYNTESDDRCELYRIHIGQKDPLLISKGADQKRFASWATSFSSRNH
jgi:TolB protein